MKNHTDLLNFLIKNFDLKSYCEIGVQNKKNNFNLINVEEQLKIGIDPDPVADATYQMPSDQYFALSKSKFDLFFVDGLHHANQVKKDFDNALECLEEGGFIMLHDCHPLQEIHSQVPRNGLRGIWTGDVYKFIMCLSQYKGIDFRTVDFDNGCCIVWKTSYQREEVAQSLTIKDITWNIFHKNKHLLRLIAPIEETILNQIQITYGK